MIKNAVTRDTFMLTGQLKGFILKDGYKIKYLRIQMPDLEYWIKVRKEQRQNLESLNTEGTYLKVTGERKICHKTGKVKLKADLIEVIEPRESNFSLNHNSSESTVVSSSSQNNKTQQASILICQKSDCWKRGGQAVYAELTENLAKCGLSEQVKIRTTGCLKKCKQGPNLVFMPDRAHYSQVKTQEIEQLLAQHVHKNCV